MPATDSTSTARRPAQPADFGLIGTSGHKTTETVSSGISAQSSRRVSPCRWTWDSARRSDPVAEKNGAIKVIDQDGTVLISR